MLDYWISNGIVRPTVTKKTEKRKFFYFDFPALVRIRTVKGMRDAGMSLKQIRNAYSLLESKRDAWKARWLVSDGNDIFVTTDSASTIESLACGEKGQLAFSFVAIGEIRDSIELELKNCEPVPSKLLRSV